MRPRGQWVPTSPINLGLASRWDTGGPGKSVPNLETGKSSLESCPGLPKSPGRCLLATLNFQSLLECWGGSPLILAEARTAGGMGDHGMGMPIARAFIFRTQFVPPDLSTGRQKQVNAGLGEIGWNWGAVPLELEALLLFF